MWEFYERFAQKAGLAPEMAAYYARHVGDVLSGAVPQEELDTVREKLPPDYWELSERVLADPHRYGSFERKSNPLEAADAPMQKKS